MHSFDDLENRVENGTIRLLQIVGVPRSMSTALGRALNEIDTESVYVNEPFNRENTSINTAAAFILDACRIIEPVGNSPLTVVTKNMASYLGHDDFEALESVSVATIWSVRDPLIQIGSLLTRIVNDLHVRPGADEIKQSDINPYLESACSFLIHSAKSIHFSKTGWSSIKEHFQTAPQATRRTIDGTHFAADPHTVLSAVCAQLSIGYNTTMVEGWSGQFINVINRDDENETVNSAWTKTVAGSAGIIAADRPPLDLMLMPTSLREHITKVAIPTYQQITSDTQASIGPT